MGGESPRSRAGDSDERHLSSGFFHWIKRVFSTHIMSLGWFGVLVSLSMALAEIKIAILMQGSDFINISIVPTFDVNQFDLGDVFISPCRAGTYNDVRDSFCKDCSVCASSQYERDTCVAIHNRVCANCTVCTEREQEMCACSVKTAECVTGDRVCLPLPPTSANITFDLYVDVQLSPLKERFLQEGLRTGFILFLSDYLQHSTDSIVFMYMTKLTPKSYAATFIINDVYSLYTKTQVSRLTRDIVQGGLTNTFGVQSNTFSTVTQQRRRLLQQSPISLSVDHVDAQCISQGACSRFFTMTNPDNPCESSCVSLPCPPGYTGFYGVCEICPNATYKEVDGNESCVSCPLGFSSDQGTANASLCTPPPPTAPVAAITTTNALVTSAITTPPSPLHSLNITHVGLTSVPSITLPRTLPRTTSSNGSLATVSKPTPLETTLRMPEPSVSGGPPATSVLVVTAPPPPGGTSVWGEQSQQIINNFYYYNVTFLKQMFYTEWNSGKAGTIQYITINEERDEWALTMVCALMVAGFLSIAAIGVRLFFVIERPSANASQTIQPKKEIKIPIVRHHYYGDDNSSDDDDDNEHTRLLPSGKHSYHLPPPHTFFPRPRGPFLESIAY